ncbi:MAG TPA: hypothetical protein VFU02_15080 [Polyangiaceae bacterium]|nr:hypothetical protein [Polyangiaceae bacterium]
MVADRWNHRASTLASDSLRAQLAEQVSRAGLWVIPKRDIVNLLLAGYDLVDEASTADLRQLGLQLRADAIIRVQAESSADGVRLDAAILRACGADEPVALASVTEETVATAALTLARRLAADSTLYARIVPGSDRRQCRLTTH